MCIHAAGRHFSRAYVNGFLECRQTNVIVYVHMQDPVAGSRAGDLVKLCNEGHHPSLNQMFHAAGTPALEGGGVMGEPPAQQRARSL